MKIQVFLINKLSEFFKIYIIRKVRKIKKKMCPPESKKDLILFTNSQTLKFDVTHSKFKTKLNRQMLTVEKKQSKKKVVAHANPCTKNL